MCHFCSLKIDQFFCINMLNLKGSSICILPLFGYFYGIFMDQVKHDAMWCAGAGAGAGAGAIHQRRAGHRHW
jgi:hypothetical protein